MALNKGAAISYNKERGYSQKAIGIIQFVVGAKTTGVWDNQAVEAVYAWQQSKNGQIASDGKVGPETLGYFIGELELAYRKPDADVLRQFPHKMRLRASPANRTPWTSSRTRRSSSPASGSSPRGASRCGVSRVRSRSG